ncbi:hypothetical protein SteCoe_2525 [Stentor coeruleus]|uniref:Tyrosine-protein kinase ephrin type A/B receptor-like domain-containing protein n=1 Tax=Stentor coeruleus TaxID=5963 RepID=A0A1R2CZA1_9CILI|nr:hypothetical protein SteCoe_2525 [Stentor coeruleus]
MLFLLLKIVSSLKITNIPESGSPPNRLTGSAAVYDEVMNRIITFGGIEYRNNIQVNSVLTFDLNFLKWGEIKTQSTFIPDGRELSSIYLKPDRKLLVFFGVTASGISSDVYSFNLETGIWKAEDLTGDAIPGRDGAGFASFTYSDTHYVAFFGGLTLNSLDDNLYIINTQSLEVQKMPKVGDLPSKLIGSSLVYWNKLLILYGCTDFTNLTGIDSWSFSLENKIWGVLNAQGQKPKERFYHIAYIYLDDMYIMFGFVLGGVNIIREAWKLDLIDLKWTQITNNTIEARAQCAVIGINSTLYCFYGRDEITIFNSILTIDLAYNPLEIKYLTHNWDSPIKRINHCSFRVNTFMYIFGGMSESGVYLNDMWKYDMINSYWISVSMQGTVPSPRASFSCVQPTGETLVIFGGRDSENVYGDMYAYRADESIWIVFESSTTTGLSPRYNLCMAHYNLKFYITGGQDFQNSFEDLWYFDFIKLEFISIAKHTNVNIIKHKCWASKENNELVINVVGGCSIEDYPNFDWIQIKIMNDNTYEVSTKLTSEKLGFSEIALSVAEEHFYIIFGSLWDEIISSSITKVNLISGEITVFSFPEDTGLYGHTVCHWKDTFFIFGGGISRNIFKIENSATSNLRKIENSENSNEIQCGIGAILPNCTPCQAGEYYQDKSCIPCPKGKFSKNLASIGEEHCIPCASGKFSDKEGSSYCLDCNYQSYCPLGSIKPRLPISSLKKSEIYPKNYLRQTSYASNFVFQIMMIACIGCAFTTLIVLLIKKVWDKIQILDLFVKKHRNELGIPIVHRRTSLGGLFTIFFILLSLASLASSILAYSTDNITEIKSLIPSITIDKEIKSSFFHIESIFYIYGGVCTVNNTCHPNINFISQGLFYKQITKTCIKIDEDTCKIVLEFIDFYVDSSLSYIILQLEEKNSYAGYFTINVTSPSSIPESFSSVFIPVEPLSSVYVFKGTNPSLVYFKLIPSLFTSQSSRWKDSDAGYHLQIDKDTTSRWKDSDTGYHLQIDKDTTIGSISSQKLINLQFYLYVQIVLSKSETGLNTQRIINNSLFVFISGLLGSIFGLMNMISFFMTLAEVFADKYFEKVSQDKLLKTISSKAKLLKREFGYYRVKCKNIKVSPLNETELSN